MAGGCILFEGRISVPADVFDLANFRRWVHSDEFPERARASFLAGEIHISISPEEISTHTLTKGDVFGGLWTWVREKDTGNVLLHGALVVHEQAELATEPDVMFCSWDSYRSGRVRHAEWPPGSGREVEVVGSPDLVVEIVSQSSVRKDTVLLPERYFAAGVDEYWLIDARGEQVDFQLLARGDRDYVPVEPDAEGYRSSQVLKAAFRILRQRDPVGGPRYRLLAR